MTIQEAERKITSYYGDDVKNITERTATRQNEPLWIYTYLLHYECGLSATKTARMISRSVRHTKHIYSTVKTLINLTKEYQLVLQKIKEI